MKSRLLCLFYTINHLFSKRKLEELAALIVYRHFRPVS